MLADELVQVVENLALPLREWKHGETIRKRKAKVKEVQSCRPTVRLETADLELGTWNWGLGTCD
jgi:hypothetical protein